MVNSQSNIVLDFFAGSGTTAQAVMELNKEDGGNRTFILVQSSEPLNDMYKSGFKTIFEFMKERVKRASIQIDDTTSFKHIKICPLSY